jgi:membrane-associated protease RseP (regulator of RpoE activity)
LEGTLTRESREREKLSEDLARLRVELHRIAQLLSEAGRLADPPAESFVSSGSRTGEAGAIANETPSVGPPNGDPAVARPETGPGGRPWFDLAALTRLGLSDSEVERLHEQWESYQMEWLSLRDDLHREGSESRPANAERLAEFELDLRLEMGDEDYDRLLFAAGKPNRVLVTDLISRSPGERAGLETGDTILSYNGLKIFRPRDLVTAISAAEAGEQVWIEARTSGGETKDIRIPAGPIGIKMGVVQQAPELD